MLLQLATGCCLQLLFHLHDLLVGFFELLFKCFVDTHHLLHPFCEIPQLDFLFLNFVFIKLSMCRILLKFTQFFAETVQQFFLRLQCLVLLPDNLLQMFIFQLQV